MTPEQAKEFIHRAFTEAETYLRVGDQSRLIYGLGLCSGIHSSLLAIVPPNHGKEWDQCFRYFEKKRDNLLDQYFPGTNPDLRTKA